jgi:hypothetical protein
MRLASFARMGGVMSAMLLVVGQARAAEPAPPIMQFVFEEQVALAAAIPAGKTPYGERNIIPITGGTFAGPEIKGTIIPGGWDWQLRRADGCLDVKADYMLRTDDGVIINVVNTGVICRPQDGKPMPIRTHPKFEAPLGKYAWLGQTAFIGTLEPMTGTDGKPGVRIRFFKAM